MQNISANPEHALFLPAPNQSYVTNVMKSPPRPLPAGLTMADLNYFSPQSQLFTYNAGLYSAAFGVGDAGPTMISARDRGATTVVGDSGGYSVIGGSIKTPQHIFRVQALQWQEAHCDVGIVLDVPTRSLDVPRSGFTHFDQCLDQTLENTQFAISKRSRPDLILCNVMQGRTFAEAEAWFDRISPYQADLEGIALAGDTKQDLWAWNKRLIQMRDRKLLDRLKWIHVLGTAQPGFGVMLTGWQKALRKYLNPDIRISFDSALGFRNVHAHHRITRGLRNTGKDYGFWEYRFPKDANALDRSKPFPFPGPLGDLCTYGDFNPGNAGATGGWDGMGLTMLSNHEVYREVTAIAEANRLAEVERTTAGSTPWHIRRSWEAFDLIWGTKEPDTHLKKYKKFLAFYSGGVTENTEEDR